MSTLFSPSQIGPLRIKNRFVRSATAERAFGKDGACMDSLIPLYEDLARGGTGLIVTGYTYVQLSGRSTPLQAGFSSWEQASGWGKVLEACRRVDPEVRVFLQLVHGGRQIKVRKGEEALAPSALEDSSTGVLPRAMTHEEIEDTLHAFARSAGWAKEVGFDGVQLHGAHGYLISEFTSPHTNRRDDEWGGSPEKRRRFLLEAYRRTRAAVGVTFPVLVKLNIHDCLPGGLVPEEAREAVKALCEEGIDGVEMSGGMFESSPATAQPGIDCIEKEAYFFEGAALIRKGISCPLILVGGMRSRERMEEVLESGVADFVGLCRPLIREPNLPVLMKKGKARSDCTSCNGCLLNRRSVTHCVLLEKEANQNKGQGSK